MLHKLPALQALINQLRLVPFLASRNVYRVALHMLTAPDDKVQGLVHSIESARKHIAPCKTCGAWAQDAELCVVCSDPRRDQSLVCVVEEWTDMFAIERLQEFSGVYHVLGGALNPLEGIGPEKLRITPLAERIQKGAVREIIFAINPTPEGEATVSYVRARLPQSSVQYSRLASGMPTGGQLAYMDRTTIHKALVGRQTME
jgi:recombination protein RecR